MKQRRLNESRRRFVRSSVTVTLGAPLLSLLPHELAAAEMPRVNLDDPTATSLQYTHDASTVDPAKRGGDDRVCSTCQFYTAPASTEWGPCSLFPGKSVAAKGWCLSWVKKT